MKTKSNLPATMAVFFFTTFSLVGIAAVGSTGWASVGHKDADENLAGHPGDSKKVSRTVRLVASEIKFNFKQLTFKTGETVRFVLVNKGEQDHELTIGDSETQQEHRKVMLEIASMPNADMSRMPPHEHVAESAIAVKPGETKELVWQFTKAGSFEFACNFPGHAEVGMAGTITVR